MRYKETNKNIINRYGITFSKWEIKSFRQLVRKVNRLRRYYINQAMKRTGFVLAEPEFYFDKQSQKLNRFMTKKKFTQYKRKLEKYADFKTYRLERDTIYFNRYKRIVRSVFDKQHATKIINKMQDLGIKRFVEATRDKDITNISFFADSLHRSSENPEPNEIEDELDYATAKSLSEMNS